jgi:hypothetical protein
MIEPARIPRAHLEMNDEHDEPRNPPRDARA